MTDIFLKILNMSITASYVIVFVLVARLLLKKAPKIFSYSMWAVVLFRLVCPVTFKSMFSFFRPTRLPLANKLVTMPSVMSNVVPQTGNIANRLDNAEKSTLPLAEMTNITPMQVAMLILAIIWILGICVMLVYSIVGYIKLKRRVEMATIVEGNIFECDSICSPFVMGIMHPKIYLPMDLTLSEKCYVIKHEQVHIKRLDYIIKPFAYLTLCIHWFNPLVWLSFKLMSKDMEMSCDEKVIAEMGDNIRKEYSSSLLNFATGRNMFCGSPLTFGENSSKSRIKNVLSYKKPSFWIIIVAIMIVGVLSIGLLTNPKNELQDAYSIGIKSLSDVIEKRDKILVVNAGEGATLMSGKSILETLSIDDWKPKNVSSPYELSSDIIIHLDDKKQTRISLYSTDDIAMVLYGDSYQYFDIPKDIYNNLMFKIMVNSFYIPKEVVRVVTSGKMTNLESVNETPSGVSDFIRFSIGDVYHTMYEKDGKFYCESPYQYIKEITKKVYDNALEYLEKMDFSGKINIETEVPTPKVVNDAESAIIDRKHNVITADWDLDKSLGVDMVTLDYASKQSIIFHGYFGLFVYDLKELEIVRSLNLNEIGCAAAQGDDYCEVMVSQDGNIVQLHPMSSDTMFVYNVSENTLRETNYKKMENRFSNFKITEEVIDTENSATFSYKAVEFDNNQYGYLHATDWTLRNLNYVYSDMVYKLFK